MKKIILNWENCERLGFARRANAERALAKGKLHFEADNASVVERHGRFFVKSFQRKSYVGDLYQGTGGRVFIGI